MSRRSRAFAVLLSALGAAAAAAPPEPASGDWPFEALLDGKPIGTHRFTLRTEGDLRVLESRADFTVRILGVPVYRYHHEATERWRGDCLERIDARTDDDGKATTLQAVAPEGLLAGCTMSFAYWNPAALQRQQRLLNPQTGKTEPVRFEALGTERITVRGAEVEARRLRITGPAQPIDLWYSNSGDWLALESSVAGGRRLRYRLH